MSTGAPKSVQPGAAMKILTSVEEPGDQSQLRQLFHSLEVRCDWHGHQCAQRSIYK